MSDLVRVFSEAVRNSRMLRPQLLLQVDEWIDVPGHYRFGLVWPWERQDAGNDLVDSRGLSTGMSVDVLAVAPRTEGSATVMFWREDGAPDSVVPRGTGKSFSRLYGGRLQEERLVELGGARAAYISIATRYDHLWRVMAPRPKGSVHVEMRVPLAHAGGYRPHLDTILGSWRWLD